MVKRTPLRHAGHAIGGWKLDIRKIEVCMGELFECFPYLESDLLIIRKMILAGIYLCNDMNVKTLKAYVMPENIYSQKVLLKNGFIKEHDTFPDRTIDQD